MVFLLVSVVIISGCVKAPDVWHEGKLSSLSVSGADATIVFEDGTVFVTAFYHPYLSDQVITIGQNYRLMVKGVIGGGATYLERVK